MWFVISIIGTTAIDNTPDNDYSTSQPDSLPLLQLADWEEERSYDETGLR